MQTIWITGGSSGIGFAVAKKFLKKNWFVVISSSNNYKLDQASLKLKKYAKNNYIFSLVCDITDYDQVNDTVSKIEKTGLKLYTAFGPNNTPRDLLPELPSGSKGIKVCFSLLPLGHVIWKNRQSFPDPPCGEGLLASLFGRREVWGW